MKIVIADDSGMLRERIKESIKDIKGVEIVGEARNGIEAVKIIQEKNPDFVLTDIRMSELNGIEVLKKMKEIGSKSKVCIFTNYPYSQYKTKCLAEGADYFFNKNNGFQEIKNLIEHLSRIGVGKNFGKS